jgi:Family of unknown function (DUF6390)
MNATGPALFSRYAFPPNVLGYCGPDGEDWIDTMSAVGSPRALMRVLRMFEGAYPYLELIGGCHGLDPLDRNVVEAYWIGNELLDGVDRMTWGNSLDERFRARTAVWSPLETSIAPGRPNHAFHVFCVYPWVGLLRTGHTDQALTVLDRCRIRWGSVVEVTPGSLAVRSCPLTWDGRLLALGDPIVEEVVWGAGRATLRPGDVVSMHWDYACDRLTPSQLGRLRSETTRHLAIVNDQERALASVLEA